MSEWRDQRLASCADIGMGQSPPGNSVAELGTGLPFLQGNAEFGVEHPAARFECNQAHRRAKPGDVLISVRAPVGALNVADRSYGVGRGLATVRFPDDDARYGYHVLRYAAPSLHRVSQGTTFAAVGRRELAKLAIPFPEGRERRQIARILDTLDDAIVATDRLIEKIRRRRDALRSIAVSPADDWVRRPLRSVVQSAVDGPFGSMLKSTHYVDSPGVRLVRLANVGDGEFLPGDAFISESYAAQLSRHEVEEGDVLIASLGDESHRPGRACLYPPIPKGIVKADCFRLRPNVAVADPYFLTLLINGATCAAAIRRLAQGVTRDRVNLGNLLGLIVALPKPEVQRAWVHRFVAADSEITVEVEKGKKLRAVRVGLADDLLTGRARTVPA
jgi:type I restriction enzyme S subunit